MWIGHLLYLIHLLHHTTNVSNMEHLAKANALLTNFKHLNVYLNALNDHPPHWVISTKLSGEFPSAP
jgi:hypothetical protein